MPLKLKDLSQYLNFAKKLVNASERIKENTISSTKNRFQIR